MEGFKMASIGDKFIIEIEDVYNSELIQGKSKTLYRIKNFNSLVFDDVGLSKLTQYNFVNRQEYEEILKEEYTKGLNDAWNAVKDIDKMSSEDIKEVFELEEYEMWLIHKHFTATEVIEKIKDYEQQKQQNKKIYIGDEVIAEGCKFIVTEIHENSIGGIDFDGDIFTYEPNRCTKTGEHSDKLIKILRELKNDE